MKKILIGILISFMILFSTGCNNNTNNKYVNKVKDDNSGTLVCTKSETDEDNMTTEDTIKIQYKNNIVKSVESSTIIQTLPEYLDMTISLSQALIEKFNEVNGLNYKVSKKDDSHIETTISVDYNKIDVDKLNELLSTDDEEENNTFINSIKNKNLTLDEYKTQNLDGYSCK